jgi:aryl-alcohol dehydrogenase-like predicted oxidoreductase
MILDQYYLLGRSGLRVSRLALGTMTFGTEGIRGIAGSWGASKETSHAIFERYIDAGGNFLDTADSYTAGTSETMLGEFVANAGLRDRVVIATKFSNNLDTGNPNAGGNGRKNMMRAVEASLRRLKTDYVDLYFLHTWDRMTPAEEVMRTFDDLVRAGKIRYAGLSDVPGWYAARAQTWAEAHALTPPVGLQLPYSLVERSIEHEFVPLAQNLGLGLTVWSPLGMGMLSGKYRPDKSGATGEGRLTMHKNSEGLGHFTPRNWQIVTTLEGVARELGRSMAQVAVNWVATQPGIAAAILGASKSSQIDETLTALDFTIPAELRQRLDEVSATPPAYPYALFTDKYQAGILSPGCTVGDKPEGYAPPLRAEKTSDFAFRK